MILDKKVLEFYKWDGNLAELIQNVKEKLNEVAGVSSMSSCLLYIYIYIYNCLVTYCLSSIEIFCRL